MKKNILFCLLLTLTTLTILIGVGLSSNPTSAASASTATATVKIAASCTISGGGNYNATVPPGTSAEIAGSTLTITCNDTGGFALYAVGNSGDEYGNNNMIGPSVNIPSDTTSTGSYWAMKITPATGNTPTIENSFNDFKNVPIVHTKVASYSGSTGTGSLSVNATYKANIISSQIIGNYLGKVKYTLIHPSSGPTPVTPLASSDCPALSICYAPNADDIEGTMRDVDFSTVAASSKAGRQTKTLNGSSSVNITTNSTVLLAGYNYSRPGYGFAGWSTSYEASTASGSTDTIYGPQATISTNPSDPDGVDISTNGLILYPVWVASAGSMQTFTSANCSAMNIGDVTARMDIRDNNVYAIAKLVDGKCWMIENLRLDNDANITTSNTQSNNGTWGGVFTGLAEPERTNFGTSNPNSLYSTNGTTANVISGGNAYNSQIYRMPRYNNDNTNRSLTVSYSRNSSGYYYQWYSYGNYYTWAAAIADTTEYRNANQSINTTSLCPTGWRLPRGGNKNNESNNEFWALIVTGLNNGVAPANYDSTAWPSYTDAETEPVSNALRSYPNNFLYNGHFVGSSSNRRGTMGTYNTSTADGDYDYFSMSMINSRVYPGTSYDVKDNGKSSRCLAGS